MVRHCSTEQSSGKYWGGPRIDLVGCRLWKLETRGLGKKVRSSSKVVTDKNRDLLRWPEGHGS